MIHLECTGCHRSLEIDDGFAGGVCRCQHCGTIQTVPSHLKHKRPEAPVSGAPVPRSRPAAHSNAPADDLAEVVASSGLSQANLFDHLRPHHKPISADSKRLVLIISVSAGALLLGVIIGLIAFFRSPTTDNAPDGQNTRSAGENRTSANPRPGANGTAIPKLNYGGIALKGPSIVFLIDRSNGTRDSFDQMRAAVFRTLDAMGKDRKFQIVFWEVDGQVAAFPENSLLAATPDNISRCRDEAEMVVAQGRSNALPALARAVQQNPAEIVLVTGKTGLEAADADAIVKALKGRNTPIHAVSVNGGGPPEILKAIADKTGGSFREVTRSDLE